MVRLVVEHSNINIKTMADAPNQFHTMKNPV